MRIIKSLLIIVLIPVILCCSCTYSTELVATTTPQPMTTATPTATKVVIDEEQAIALAREAAIEYLEYDETKLATKSDMEALENEDYESLMKGELRYIDDLDTMTPEVKTFYFKNRKTWSVDFSLCNTKCISLGVVVYVDGETGGVVYVDRTV